MGARSPEVVGEGVTAGAEVEGDYQHVGAVGLEAAASGGAVVADVHESTNST
jgi:hypothetical protein